MNFLTHDPTASIRKPFALLDFAKSQAKKLHIDDVRHVCQACDFLLAYSVYIARLPITGGIIIAYYEIRRILL
jgi:hypothetical protein